MSPSGVGNSPMSSSDGLVSDELIGHVSSSAGVTYTYTFDQLSRRVSFIMLSGLPTDALLQILSLADGERMLLAVLATCRALWSGADDSLWRELASQWSITLSHSLQSAGRRTRSTVKTTFLRGLRQ